MLLIKKLKYKSTQNKWRYSFQFYSTLAQLVLLATLLVTYTVFYRTKAEFINMMEMHFIEWLVRTIRHNPNRITHRFSYNISVEQIIKFTTIEYSLEILIRKVQRAEVTRDVIKYLSCSAYVMQASKLVPDWSMRWSRDMLLKELHL